MKKTTAHLDVIVVGAGPAGLGAARKIQEISPESSILVLESGDKACGRVLVGPHLLDATAVDGYPLQTSQIFLPLKVRWERQWMDPLDVDWKSKEWIHRLPQWSLYMRGSRALFDSFHSPTIEVSTKCQCPVSEIAAIEQDGRTLWKLTSPCGEFTARTVYWAAGITAFQNAYGKIPAQSFLVANPRFDEEAMDFRGGMAVDFALKTREAVAADVPADHLLGLPVRYEGKLYLSFAMIRSATENQASKILTLTHLPAEMIQDPKVIASFQKALRRSIKALLVDESAVGGEKWVVSPAIFGHVMGLRGIFGDGIPDSLEFLGDETLKAQGLGHWDLLSALDSFGPVINGMEAVGTRLSEEFRESIPRIVL